MRGIYFLLGVLMAISGGTAYARPSDSCVNNRVEARLVCRIKVKVTVTNNACTAEIPRQIDVSRNPDGHPILMLFYIREDENNRDLKFHATDGVTLTDGSSGTPWGQVFERQFQDRRVFLVKNKNPANEDFNYEISVWNGGTKCASPDPLIHNTN